MCNSVRGFKTGLRKAVVKKQTNPRSKKKQKETAYQTTENNSKRKSIPHVEVIINGQVLTDAVLDGGSISTLISYDTVRALGNVQNSWNG